MNEEELMEISERMGNKVHKVWMEKRRKEKGWHSPEECPIRKAERISVNASMMGMPLGKFCDNCHPCMRPYKDLPDSVKELDREYPKVFLKILNEMGFQVIKRVGYIDTDEFYKE